MKIAIYHNLNPGGGIVQLIKFIESTKNKNQITIYSHNNNLSAIQEVTHKQYPLSSTKNIYEHLVQILYELPQANKTISDEISKNNFDVILVFPCCLTQSPDILRLLKNKNVTYIFAERIREFYEKTTFDHNSVKKTFARIIRMSLKFKDWINCRSAPKIVSNSVYSRQILQTTYGKKSTVIYPGLKYTIPKTIHITNTDKALIVGQLSYSKGYDSAIDLLSNAGYKQVTVVGRKTADFPQISEYASKKDIRIKLIETEDDNLKDLQYKLHGVFVACQRDEPFGITTMEACYNNNIVFGINEGGTPEIVQNGLNGFLFNRKNIYKSSKLLSIIKNQKNASITKTMTIDWQLMANKIINFSK